MSNLFPEEKKPKSGPVECLGITFENDEARRAYFLDKLKAKLKDPEFRKIEGFPIGKDEDILALSDPPYYTACPNPFIPDFIKLYGKPFDPKTDNYKRKPFATDVSEGKNHPIYNAHSYHTKVPHKAIMRYILHYTEPGDVVFDGFGGTGMTGVAAQLCGDKKAVEELGYRVDSDGVVSAEEKTDAGKSIWKPFSRLGARRAVLNDLSPAATLIAAGYCLTTDSEGFAQHASRLLGKFNQEYGWMYQTRDPRTKTLCPVDFTVWSEIFSCPYCTKELEFWKLAYNETTGKVRSESRCPSCSAELSKRNLVRCTTTYYDSAIGATRTRQLLRPVEIHYRHKGIEKTKKPDDYDRATLSKAEKLAGDFEYPTELMMFVAEGEEWGDQYRGYHEGVSRVHDFFLPRQLAAFSSLWHMGKDLPTAEMRRLWRFTLQSVVVSFTRRNRFLKTAYSQVNRALSGTLYLGSTVSEPSPTYVLRGKIRRFGNAIPEGNLPAAITTQSLSSLVTSNNSVDYAFLDPPFGDNLPYAELNFLWEAWLRVFTNAGQDVVVNGKQKKDLAAYTSMMTSCLERVYCALRPGRWVTVEFHNSQNAVWTAIQEALGRVGFIVADVSVLNKGMKTKKQLHANAVDKDLVISAYKPNGGLEQRFHLEAGTEEGAWDFVRTHLRQLPVFVEKGGLGQVIAERQQVLLFDRMVAFHVQRGVSVPFSAGDFYQGIAQRFSERDGMYFLPDQVTEYERKRMTLRELLQLSLFVSDEASAIQWLKQQLTRKPQTFQELQPQLMRETQGRWQKHEKPLELSELLERSFLRYDGEGDVPSQVHSRLSSDFKELRNLPKDNRLLRARARDHWYVPDPNKAGDLEKLREKALLREFWEYLPPGFKLDKSQASKGTILPIPGLEAAPSALPRGRKIKVIRTEAVRVGFKHCWQNHLYDVIIAIAQRIPENVLQEDPKLLMWYTLTLTRTGRD